jgi:hypothetical protein
VLALWLVPLLAACAAPVPQADPALPGQPAQQAPLVQQVVVRDYALEPITGSHLKRRRGDFTTNGQTISPEDWERARPGACPTRGCM